ncbi:hypothetical protein JW921_09905, partial [Candidatus Fermentibacterales bacterium]|nr:hypothetical protein [Candidatus Fermentibacterales bacterium]
MSVDRALEAVGSWFPETEALNLGGGFPVARMPGEPRADLTRLGEYARRRFEEFAQRTGQRLIMEVEPGTLLVAGAGFLLTSVLERRKGAGRDVMEFVVVDGGMDCLLRPMLYGSSHPFSVVSAEGRLLSAEGTTACGTEFGKMVVVGVCCETGDCLTLDCRGTPVARSMARPDRGDFLVVGGAGAYGSTMSVSGYNSRLQAPEVLVGSSGDIRLCRKRQSLLQLVQNERGLEAGGNGRAFSSDRMYEALSGAAGRSPGGQLDRQLSRDSPGPDGDAPA